MLRSVEVRVVLTGVPGGELFHGLHWLPKIELSVDCFRMGRTTIIQAGMEQAVCTSDEEHGRYPAPARVAAFDTTTSEARLILRAVVDYWWAPFHDTKRDQDATALTDTPWVRVHFGSSRTPTWLRSLADHEVKVTLVGGPTAILEVAGLRLLTDPTFSEPAA